MTDAVITTDGLTRRFGALTAVHPLNLDVQRGEMFGLVGPDGAGKTTAIRMLVGILAPSGGAATILGNDLMHQVDAIKRRIGYLSQRFTLYGDLSIDENIEFFAEIHGVLDYRPRREELLEFTRLTPFRDRLADRLSGGMKQKLALACTLIHTPEIIFLDEPTTGVDPVSRRDFWRILQRLGEQGITIVMSTPYLDEAERCNRVALMNNGRVMHIDAPAALRSLMKGDIVEVLVDDVRAAGRLLKGNPRADEVQTFGDRLNILVHDAHHDIPLLTGILRDAGLQVTSTRILTPSLENVFISLLTHATTDEVAS